MRRLLVTVTTAIFLLGGMRVAAKQSVAGQVCDYLKSEAGRPVGIPGATVSVIQNEKVLASQASGKDGSYLFDGLPEGTPLRLKVELPGYVRFPTLKPFQLDKSPLRLDVNLLRRKEATNANVASRLKERLGRDGANRSTELSLLTEFGLEEEKQAILALVETPKAFGGLQMYNGPPKPQIASIGKPRLAVVGFSNKADNHWWLHGGAEAAQDVFVTELIKSGKFRVIERENLEALMMEKNLSLSGDVNPKQAIAAGKLLGVNYLLTGSITEYGAADKSAHGPGVGGLPGFSVGKKTFVAAINARLIDTSTGEILWADEARAEESSARISVGSFGGKVDDERFFDKVLKPCIQQLTASLKAADL